ncbi:hypothetical protein [Streptomyces sp. NPDC088847]|uniref:hypothetical protein n=1 Tax=Streptomyces sp. NPDC088847 TaxID=3365909 RepID=UPI0038279533
MLVNSAPLDLIQGAECYEAGKRGSSEWSAGEPGIDAGEVDGRADEVVLQPDPGETTVTGSVQAKRLDAL